MCYVGRLWVISGECKEWWPGDGGCLLGILSSSFQQARSTQNDAEPEIRQPKQILNTKSVATHPSAAWGGPHSWSEGQRCLLLSKARVQDCCLSGEVKPSWLWISFLSGACGALSMSRLPVSLRCCDHLPAIIQRQVAKL